MIRGFYTALSGVVAAMTRQSIVADAIANVNTPGYKAPQSGEDDFGLTLARSLGGELGQLGTATYATDAPIDTTPGAVQQTGLPTDLAISGDGLFVVQMADGSRAYTRAGNFLMDATGALTTENGQKLLDTAGKPITVASGFSVAPDGTVSGTNQKIALVAWPASGLARMGTNLYTISGATAAATGTIRQGALEMSNVDLAGAMTDLMMFQRQFSLAARAMTIQEQTLEDATGVGRLR